MQPCGLWTSRIQVWFPGDYVLMCYITIRCDGDRSCIRLQKIYTLQVLKEAVLNMRLVLCIQTLIERLNGFLSQTSIDNLLTYIQLSDYTTFLNLIGIFGRAMRRSFLEGVLKSAADS